jgi:opacity protein-like surface antigen
LFKISSAQIQDVDVENLRFKAEVGALGGVSYYQGDVNPNKLFYSSNPAFGGFYQYNFSSRLSVRASATFGTLSGNDLDFQNTFQQTRAYKFTTSLTEFSWMVGFNFFNLNPKNGNNNWTPYLIGGAAAYLTDNPLSKKFKLSWPIGFGFKFCPTDRMTIGIEWVYRITDDNNIDMIQNATFQKEFNSQYQNRQKSFNYVTDYYSVACLTLSFKIFELKKRCSAYGYKKM